MSLDKKRSTLALLALAISAFAIGTTEFISVGLLPLIATDLHIASNHSRVDRYFIRFRSNFWRTHLNVANHVDIAQNLTAKHYDRLYYRQ